MHFSQCLPGARTRSSDATLEFRVSAGNNPRCPPRSHSRNGIRIYGTRPCSRGPKFGGGSLYQLHHPRGCGGGKHPAQLEISFSGEGNSRTGGGVSEVRASALAPCRRSARVSFQIGIRRIIPSRSQLSRVLGVINVTVIPDTAV